VTTLPTAQPHLCAPYVGQQVAEVRGARCLKAALLEPVRCPCREQQQALRAVGHCLSLCGHTHTGAWQSSAPAFALQSMVRDMHGATTSNALAMPCAANSFRLC
jgi:hypothetical protein